MNVGHILQANNASDKSKAKGSQSSHNEVIDVKRRKRFSLIVIKRLTGFPPKLDFHRKLERRR